MNGESRTKPFQIAPMNDLFENWVVNQEVGLDWYFKLQKKMGSEGLFFDRVRPFSDLYFHLVEKSEKYGLAPEFSVSLKIAMKYQSQFSRLNPKVSFVFIIDDLVSTSELAFITSLQDSRFKFVIVFRKDRDFQSIFKSFPQILRSSLFVDIPFNLGIGTSFVRLSQVPSLKRWLHKEYPWSQVRSYDSMQRIRQSLPQSSIQEIDTIKRASVLQPNLSVILPLSLSEKEMDLLLQKVKSQSCELVCLAERTHKFGGLPSLTLVQVDEFQGRKPNKNFLSNYMGFEARGHTLLFLTEEKIQKLLFDPSIQFEDFKRDFVKREYFLRANGLNPWIEDDKASMAELLNSFKTEKTSHKPDGEEANKFRQQISWHMVDSRFDVSFLDSSDRVVQGKSLEEVLMNTRLNYRRKNLLFLNRHLAKFAPASFMQGQLQVAIDFFHNRLWKLKPSSYELYWRVKYFPITLAWRLFSFHFRNTEFERTPMFLESGSLLKRTAHIIKYMSYWSLNGLANFFQKIWSTFLGASSRSQG